jgi:hypothetical protein
MKCLLCLIFILLLPVTAAPSWVVISLESAVKDSELIVVGTLRNISEETRDGVDYGSGEIKVAEVLWGDARQGRKLSLVWENLSGIDCPRVDHRGYLNRQVIWLLKLRVDGKVAADNPGRSVPVEKKEKVIELLRAAGKI